MEYEGIIYRYKSPSGKYYIGQTINEESRRYNFLHDKRYGGIKIDYARNKYGPENFEYTVLMKVTGDNREEVIGYLNQLEQFFIKRYDSIKNGYNSSEGGKNGLLSEETKKKMSEVRKGHPTSEETKKKISEKHKGKVYSEETRKKMSESRKGVSPWNKGKVMTDEYKMNCSLRQKGKKSGRRGKKYGHRVYNPDGSFRIIRTVEPEPINTLW